MARNTEQLTVDGKRITVSNLNKVLYRGDKFIKADASVGRHGVPLRIFQNQRTHGEGEGHNSRGDEEHSVARSKWTTGNHLRHSRFIAPRNNKRPADVGQRDL
jgi:hypothetical protein